MFNWNEIEIVNLTPHSIFIKTNHGMIEIKPSGTVARVSQKDTLTENTINGILISKTEYGKVENLPQDYLGKVFIVSSMVLDKLSLLDKTSNRYYAPDTGPSAIRDDQGKIVAVTRLRAPS